jgi:uncharacterized protein YdeI (YjbR/CyaY-like superfamily)
MARAAEAAPILTVRNRADLRDWLAAHHAEPGPVWLASFKRHHPDYLAYEPQVEELLCWGWIDSVTRALDADRTMILIAPRNPRSAWSAINKAHVERARASGAMTPAGEAKVAAAMANGQWRFLDEVERLEVPGDLAEALGPLRPGWDAWPKSVQRGTLEWIKTAKTAPTRAARIADVTASLREDRRPKPFRRRDQIP